MRVPPDMFTVRFVRSVPAEVVAVCVDVPVNESVPVWVKVPAVWLKFPATVTSEAVAQVPLPVKERFWYDVPTGSALYEPVPSYSTVAPDWSVGVLTVSPPSRRSVPPSWTTKVPVPLSVRLNPPRSRTPSVKVRSWPEASTVRAEPRVTAPPVLLMVMSASYAPGEDPRLNVCVLEPEKINAEVTSEKEEKALSVTSPCASIVPFLTSLPIPPLKTTSLSTTSVSPEAMVFEEFELGLNVTL